MSLPNGETLWWIFFIAILVIWDLVLRGYALWRAAERHERKWFIALLLVNSVGILPLIYINEHHTERKA